MHTIGIVGFSPQQQWKWEDFASPVCSQSFSSVVSTELNQGKDRIKHGKVNDIDVEIILEIRHCK